MPYKKKFYKKKLYKKKYYKKQCYKKKLLIPVGAVKDLPA